MVNIMLGNVNNFKQVELFNPAFKCYYRPMRKRLLTTLTIVLVLIMIALGVLIGLNLTKLSKEIQIGTDYGPSSPPLYRYMVILDGSDVTFIEEMQEGMDKASDDYSVVYELWTFVGDDKDEMILRQLDIGIESKVDGILVQAFKDQRFDGLLSKAKRNEVPIITISDDVPSQEKVSFISYNKYQMGSRIGALLNDQLESEGKEKGTIAIIENSPLFDQDQAFAIQDQLKEGFTVEPITITNESDRILNAEGLASSIIEAYGDLVAFICLSGEETLGVVSALKDANLVDDVIIIGSDDDAEIIDYIQRGVVAATIVDDMVNIGYEAIWDLTKYNEGSFVSQYRDISVKIVNESNIGTYLKEEGDQ